MNIVILDSATLGDDISFSQIERLGSCTFFKTTPPELVYERIKNAEVVITNKMKLNRSNLENTSVRLICVAATGFDNIDVAFCKENGIAVCNVVDYSSNSVAQLTMAMVLSLSVNLKAFESFVTSGEYTKSGVANKLTPVYHELCGKTWGIIGCGNIGKKVHAAAKALGCKVIVNKNRESSEFSCVSLDELLKEADIITIHTPLTDKTREMINEKTISQMKTGVILVNAARGAVTDEKTVADAVLAGKIGAFGTDVYSLEPFPENHPFNKIMHLPNVCLTPHMAWGSFEARCRCIDEIGKNITAFINGEIRNRLDLS